jgi:hypothetical protein
MSSPLTPSFRNVHRIPQGMAHDSVRKAIRDNDQSITDLNQAISELKNQINSINSGSSTGTTNTTETTVVTTDIPANLVIGTMTTGVIPVAMGPHVLGDSHLDDGLTTPGVITSSEPVTVNDHMSIGAGTALDANTIVNIRETSTDATVTGMQIIVTHNPTVASSITEGCYMEVDANYDGQANIVDTQLFVSQAFVHSNTTRLNSLMSAYFSCDSDGACDVGELTGVIIEPFYSGSGTCDNLNSLHIKQVFGGTGATVIAGIRIEDQTPGGTNYAIYTGKGQVEFGDNLKIHGVYQSAVIYSVAGTPLPSAATAGIGARAFVSDATSTTFAAGYTGSGANKVPVYSDGTGWFIG